MATFARFSSEKKTVEHAQVVCGTSFDSPADEGCAALDFSRPTFLRVTEASEGQRIDNFLMKVLKGVPKSHVYRLIRSGEIRINKKRTDSSDHVQFGDIVRIAPIRLSERSAESESPRPLDQDELPILFEDRDILVVNKPAGLAAHGGSGISFGLIERLRASRPHAPFLELAHRLDRDTSGALIVCKSRKALVRLQQAQRESAIEKHYRLLVIGDWVNDRQHVRLPLQKYTLSNGERRVAVNEQDGLPSHTIFTLIRRFGSVSYLDAELKTGRTHQIRVHAASQGHPLVGDSKYGNYETNRLIEKGSLGEPFKRMFLHACRLSFEHPVTGQRVEIEARLPAECEHLLETLAGK